MNGFIGAGRTLLLAAAAVGAVWLSGCGDNGANSGGGNTLTDSRDGKKYKTVKIGEQKWMAENINYQVGDSWCYANDDSKCQQYGRLYNWNAAKIVCPKGWHLPSRGEWTELVTVVGSLTGGKKLKSKSGWDWVDDVNVSGNGTDDFGFTALPGGAYVVGKGFTDIGESGYWWTATESSTDKAYWREMNFRGDGVNEYSDGDKIRGGISVRCVAD